MDSRSADQGDNGPATLHRVMQTMIGEGLKVRYQPPPKLSHELFVLLMQLKENERTGRARMAPVKPRALKEAAAAP